MKNELKELFLSNPMIDKAAAETFVEIFDLPDDQFETIFKELKNTLKKSYYLRSYQESMIEQTETMPFFDYETQKDSIQNLLTSFDEDDELSDSKKEALHLMFNTTLEVFEDIAKNKRVLVEVKITKLNPDAIIPTYAHSTDAGADICAIEDTTIEPGETKIVKTGLAVAIPAGYEIQLRPRSGLSLKSPLRIANAPATIDSDYRGEIGIIVWNTDDIPYVIDKGTKIAQMVLAETPKIKWDVVESVDDLGETERGNGGFGSTDQLASKS